MDIILVFTQEHSAELAPTATLGSQGILVFSICVASGKSWLYLLFKNGNKTAGHCIIHQNHPFPLSPADEIMVSTISHIGDRVLINTVISVIDR